MRAGWYCKVVEICGCIIVVPFLSQKERFPNLQLLSPPERRKTSLVEKAVIKTAVVGA